MGAALSAGPLGSGAARAHGTTSDSSAHDLSCNELADLQSVAKLRSSDASGSVRSSRSGKHQGRKGLSFAASACSPVHTVQPELPSAFEAHSTACNVQLGRGTLVIFGRRAMQSSGSTACLLKFPTSVAGLGGSKARLQPSASLLRRLRRGKNRTVIISGDPSRSLVCRNH